MSATYNIGDLVQWGRKNPASQDLGIITKILSSNRIYVQWFSSEPDDNNEFDMAVYPENIFLRVISRS